MKLALILLLVACGTLAATGASGAQVDLLDRQEGPRHTCLDAAQAAERDHALPPSLLAAIGRVESGRWDGRSGQLAPWPWTVNAEGAGHVFATAADAIGYVAQLQASGVRSIDVGCFQVNLLYHPAAFASLEEAFDPDANSAYAAGFLAQLHARSGSWPQAVGEYHSMAPLEGAAYRQRVLLALAGRDAFQPSATLPAFADWRTRTFRRFTDPVVILASAGARSIAVVGPNGPLSPGLLPNSHMPRIIRP